MKPIQKRGSTTTNNVGRRLLALVCLMSMTLAVLGYASLRQASGSTRISDDFVIELLHTRAYVDDDNGYNLSADYNYALTVHSNGSTAYRFWYNETYQEHNQTGYENHTTTFPLNVVQEAKDVVIQEGFFSLAQRYNDFHRDNGPTKRTFFRLTVVNSDISKAVIFDENSIAGVIPRSYTFLQNLVWATRLNQTELPDVSMQVSLTKPSESLLETSVNITNNENLLLHGYWPTAPPWEAIMVKSNGCTVDYNPKVSLMVITEYDVVPLSTYELVKNLSWDVSKMPHGTYAIVISTSLTVVRYSDDTSLNPCAGAPRIYGYGMIELADGQQYVKSPPAAKFEVYSINGQTGAEVQFDASLSSDLEDQVADLKVRWDFHGDGTWDTDWSANKTASHTYLTAGHYAVRLEVKDSDGLISNCSQLVLVTTVRSHSNTSAWILAGAGIGIVVAVAVIVTRSVHKRKPDQGRHEKE